MEVNIQAIHFEVSEKLVNFINKKADRVARRNPAITDMEFYLKVVKPETSMNKQVIAKANIPQREEFVGDKTADTFEEAVDLALEAIERQIEKTKDKE